MLSSLAKKFFGSANDRLVATLQREVDAINALEPQMAALSDAELRAKTDEFRGRLLAGAKLDSLMIEAFAVVREAGKRVLGMRHFDVQLVGGMVLHKGMISEMRTGEGKTLVSTLPAYLNALSGKGVHIVTVNDYLARRDSQWMGKIHQFLGLTVGVITHGLDDDERRALRAIFARADALKMSAEVAAEIRQRLPAGGRWRVVQNGSPSASVSTSKPVSVTSSVCSAWALHFLSCVTAVQPSLRMSQCLLPRLIIGSIVKVMPGFMRMPVPRRPVCAIWGAVWNTLPMP